MGRENHWSGRFSRRGSEGSTRNATRRNSVTDDPVSPSPQSPDLLERLQRVFSSSSQSSDPRSPPSPISSPSFNREGHRQQPSSSSNSVSARGSFSQRGSFGVDRESGHAVLFLRGATTTHSLKQKVDVLIQSSDRGTRVSSQEPSAGTQGKEEARAWPNRQTQARGSAAEGVNLETHQLLGFCGCRRSLGDRRVARYFGSTYSQRWAACSARD